jgi:hypothetical protein
MPLKLNVGLSKKIGLPNYGSVGASCHVELELEQGLLSHDPAGWQHKLEQAFSACREAVNQQLDRESTAPELASQPVGNTGSVTTVDNIPGDNRLGPSLGCTRPVTPRQLRAIEGLALRQRLNLLELLESRFGKYHLESLTRSEASRLIEEIGSRDLVRGDISLAPTDCPNASLTSTR